MDRSRIRPAFRPERPGHANLVSMAGQMTHKTHHVENRRLGTYAVVLITDGGGTYADRHLGRRKVARGDALLIFPELAHSYGPLHGGRWDEYFVCFDGPVFRSLEAGGLIDQHQTVLHPGAEATVVGAFARLLAAVDPDSGTDDIELVAQVHALLAMLVLRHRRLAAEPGELDLVAAARAHLDATLLQPIDLPTLAEAVRVPYDRLRKLFVRHTGQSMQDYRIARRIDLVKSLLLEGLPLERIASQLGYCDQFFLARQFKRQTGTTPGAWRNLHGSG